MFFSFGLIYTGNFGQPKIHQQDARSLIGTYSDFHDLFLLWSVGLHVLLTPITAVNENIVPLKLKFFFL